MARNPNLSYIFKLCREDRENSVHISAGAVEQKLRLPIFVPFKEMHHFLIGTSTLSLSLNKAFNS